MARISKQGKLDIIEAVATKLTRTGKAVGGAWRALAKQNTSVRLDVADLSTSVESNLVDKQYPESDRPAAVLAVLAKYGIEGFTFETVKSWRQARDAWVSLGQPEDETLYVLIDLGRIPTDEKHKTGGRKAVYDALLAAFPDGGPEDARRKFIREYRDAKMGKKPTAMPTVPEQAVAIATANQDGYPVPALQPETVDGRPIDTFVVTHADLVAVATFGYAWRDKAGGGDRRTQAGYVLAFETALGHPLAAADEDDGSGAADAEAAERIAAIREERQAIEAKLAAS